MTYDSDALNAVLGIFRLYESAKRSFRQFWGIPILPPICEPSNRTNERAPATDGFLRGLCWGHDDLEHFGGRRPAFPSWSWTGWVVSVSSTSPGYENKDNYMSNIPVHVRVKTENGAMVDFETFWRLSRSGDSLLHSYPPIELTGLTFDLQMGLVFIEVSWRWVVGARPAAAPPDAVPAEFVNILQTLAESVELPGQLLLPSSKGLVLGTPYKCRSLENPLFVLLVRPTTLQDEIRKYERIGMIELHDPQVTEWMPYAEQEKVLLV